MNIEDENLLYSNDFKFSTFTQEGQFWGVNNEVKCPKETNKAANLKNWKITSFRFRCSIFFIPPFSIPVI